MFQQEEAGQQHHPHQPSLIETESGIGYRFIGS